MADNANDLRLKNAQWFASLLRPPFNPQDRQILLETQDYQEFINVCLKNNIRNPGGAWEGRIDWLGLRAEGVEIPFGQSLPEQPKQAPSGAGVGTAAVGLGLALGTRPEEYEDFKKTTAKYSETLAGEWEKEEEKYKKNPLKKPDPNRAASKQEAYNRAERYYHDVLAGGDLGKAKKWLRENPRDIHLAAAVDRGELQRKDLNYQEFQEIRQRYIDRTQTPQERDLANREINDLALLHSADQAKDWARDYNDPELSAAAERKRLAEEEAINKSRIRRAYHNSRLANRVSNARDRLKNSRAGRGLSKVNNGIRAVTGIPSKVRNRLAATPLGKFISKINQAYNKVMGAPGRAINRVKNRLAKSRLGRFAGRVNRIGKKISNLLNPISYLQRLFKKAIITSLVSSVVGLVSTAFGFISGLVTGIGSLISTGVAFVATKLLAAVAAAISLPISGPVLGGAVILAIIFFLIATFLSIFFPSPGPHQVPEESPYPGINYSIACPPEAPESIPSGQNIRCEILFVHDSSKSSVKNLDDVTMIVDIPPKTEVVDETDGFYIYNPSDQTVIWKLSENTTNVEKYDTRTVFLLTLMLKPLADITGEVILSFEGLGEPRGGGGVALGGDCPQRPVPYTRRNAPQDNFGDPACDYSKEKLGEKLNELDRSNATFWYLIAECESSHNPNNYFLCPPGETWPSPRCTPQRTGAWGLFQMGISKPNNPPYYAGGKGPWADQTAGAINRNKKVIHENFDYWACEEIVCRENRRMCTSNDQYISRN